jgi:hypothetical protein
MNFLPEGFEELRTDKPYWKMSQMQDGDNKLRIVQRPIAGWVDWIENKPIRCRPEDRPAKSYDPDKPLKPFWACYVWDYARKGLFILEITQASIIKALTAFGKDEDWGDFTKYDLKVRKEGTGKETRYSITPLPHKELLPEVVDALKRAPVHLENLYSGGDPWNVSPEAIAAAPTSKQPLHVEPSEKPSMDNLKTKVIDQGISIGYLDEYVKSIAGRKNESVETVVASALLPTVFPKFISTYASEVAKRSNPG